MINLYNYLETLWNSNSEYREEFDLEEFMNIWLDENFCASALHEQFFCDECIGYHYLDFDIDHKTKSIVFKVEKTEL